MRRLFHLDSDDGLLVAQEATEEVAYGFQQSVFLREQLPGVGSFALIADSGASVDPHTTQRSAYRARRDSSMRIVAKSFYFTRAGLRIDVEDRYRRVGVRDILREPDRSPHARACLAKGFQVQVFRPRKLRDSFRHHVIELIVSPRFRSWAPYDTRGSLQMRVVCVGS